MVKKVKKRTKPSGRRKNARDGMPKPLTTKRPKRKGVVQAPRAKRPTPRDVGPVDLVSEAFAEITTLAEEMRNWADNMEEKLSGTSKYQEVSECADQLEGLDEPSVDITALNDHKIAWQDPTPRRRGYSRADRASQCCDMLRAVEEKMRDLEQELPEDDPQHDAASALGDECENTISELESISFPGMY